MVKNMCHRHNDTNLTRIDKYIRLTNNVDEIERTTEVIPIFKKLFKDYDMKNTESIDNANVVFFNKLDDYNRIDKCLLKTPKLIYGLNTIDHFCSKPGLYKLLKNNLDSKTLHEVIPISYITNNTESYLKLLRNINKLLKEGTIFIMKKDVQQQKGLLITNKIKDITSSYKNKYYIIQHLLQNPYILNGRKFNLRIYMMVYIDNKSKISLYRYYDGLIYYTPEYFEKKSLSLGKNITTGYIDRSVYLENPLTIQELYDYIGVTQSKKLDQSINYLFHHLCSSIKIDIKKYENFKECDVKHRKFCVFGCDLAVDDELNVKIMEINKGPDLHFKDEKDRSVKFSMIKDLWSIVNHRNQSGFLHIV